MGRRSKVSEKVLKFLKENVFLFLQQLFLFLIEFVAGGTQSCFALTEEGHLYSWGSSNAHGQLGQGSKDNSPLPQLLAGPLSSKRVVQVAASDNHTMALTDEGDVYLWGNNCRGELGLGDTTCHHTPTLLPNCHFQGRLIKQIACSSRRSVALTEKGEVPLPLALCR